MMALFWRNAAFVYLSFIVTGLTTILPQRFFSSAAPGNAQAWLAGTLLTGTLASIAGVAMARRYGLSHRPATAGTVLVLVMTLALLWSFGVRVLLLAAALQVLIRLLANYATQEFDSHAVSSSASDRILNDRVAMLLRFAGMLLGPVWFGIFPPSSPAMLGCVLVLAALSIVSASMLKPGAQSFTAETRHQDSLSPLEWLLAGVAVSIYATYYLLASNFVYVLTTIHRHPRAEAMAGILITVVYGTAMFGTILAPASRR